MKCNLSGFADIRSLPVSLTFSRDIEEFDGPLLSLYLNEQNEPYLYYWCDGGDGAQRWLVFRVTKSQLILYELQRLDLLALLRNCRDQFVFACDLKSGGQPQAVRIVPITEVPERYLPEAGAMYEGEIANAHQSQEVFLDGAAWGYEQTVEFPRKYFQTYAFMKLFGPRGNAGSFQSNHDLTKGWIFHSLYNQMMSRAQKEFRPKLTEMAFASPGYMNIQVEDDAALDVREVLARYLRNAGSIRPLGAALKEWSNGKLEELGDDGARRHIRAVGDMLMIDTDMLTQRTSTIKNAAKALTSLLARLAALSRYHLRGSAVLVGITVPEAEVDKGLTINARRGLDLDDEFD